MAGPIVGGVPRARTQPVARRLLVVVAAVCVAAGCLPGTAFAAEEVEGNARPAGSEASVEVFLEETGWTPTRGWPPKEYPYVLAHVNKPVGWTEVEEKGEVPVEGGHGEPALSVERIAAIVGVPLERLSGLAVRNKQKEQLSLNKEEIEGAAAVEAPFVEAEGGTGGTSVLSLVSPPRAAQPGRISSGPGGVLKLVLTMDGALMELAPLRFSPAEPKALETVEFATPGIQNMPEAGVKYTYDWNFGDGEVSTEAAPKHAFPPAVENGTSNYEVSAEVVAWKNGKEISSGGKVVTVPVLTTTAEARSEEHETPKMANATVSIETTTTESRSQGSSPPARRAANGPKGAHTGGGDHSVSSAGHVGLGGGGFGGTGGGGRGGTAGDGRGIGGAAGPGEGRFAGRATQGGTQPSPTNGRSPPTESPAPARSHGRAPNPIEALTPAPPRAHAGLTGILLESVGSTLPAAMLKAGTTPSPTARPLRGLSSRSGSTVSPLGALGLVAGILAVLLLVLLGAVSELRVGWLVR